MLIKFISVNLSNHPQLYSLYTQLNLILPMDVLSRVRDLYSLPELLSVPSVADSGSERQWREG